MFYDREVYTVLEPKGWSNQLRLKGVRGGENWARPEIKSYLLIPLKEGKDLATVRSSYLRRNCQVTRDQDRRGKDDEDKTYGLDLRYRREKTGYTTRRAHREEHSALSSLRR